MENSGSENRKKFIVQPKNIEKSLEKVEKDFQKQKLQSKEDVWNKFSQKYGFELLKHLLTKQIIIIKMVNSII